eukprot:6577-Heterococcus_DN1.PRE.4
MATEKQIQMRIVATKNISKITKSMKMVSASKLRGDQERLAAARPFSRCALLALCFANQQKWTDTVTGPGTLLEKVDASDMKKHTLIVPLTSDRGLCGGVNSTITRGMKKLGAAMQKQDKDFSLMIIGEKGRSQLSRAFGPSCDRACTEEACEVMLQYRQVQYTNLKKVEIPYTFATASALATEVLKTSGNADAVAIVYNAFKRPLRQVSSIACSHQTCYCVSPLLCASTIDNSAIAYETSIKTMINLANAPEEPMLEYEFEPDNKSEILQDMYEYMLACQIYHAMMENATSEQSSRMNAMENASKNAGEMIESLTLLYNRARQSRITTELIEIISGAAALESKS